MTPSSAPVVGASHDRVPSWVTEELGSATGSGIRIGVIDSGWDRRLHDARILPGVGFDDPEDETDPSGPRCCTDDHDRIGHGTACTDLILAIAPDVEIVPVRVFGGRLETSVPILLEALHWATGLELDLVNISLGTTGESVVPLYRACNALLSAGTLPVAAVAPGVQRSIPAAFNSVIGVAGKSLNQPYDYVFQPTGVTDCLAKSSHEDVLWGPRQRRNVAGSSFAVPNITGIIALLLQRHPGSGIEAVRDFLARHSLADPASTEPSPGGSRGSPSRVE